MMPDVFLVAGLDAMARSHPVATAEAGFGDGHRAAALLSAWFLFADSLCDERAAETIRRLAGYWLEWPLFAPLPAESAEPGGLDRLLAALPRAMAIDEAHGVIFPSLALRAFRARPELITRTRVDGLLRIVDAYAPRALAVEPRETHTAAGLFADEVLSAFVAATAAYAGKFQGYSFHVLTFGQAVQDLRALGYGDLARRAEAGFRVYAANSARGPAGPYNGMAFAVTDPNRQEIRPEQPDFWLNLPWGPEFAKGLGHVIKYAYAFNALCRDATDAAAVARARDVYYLSAWG